MKPDTIAPSHCPHEDVWAFVAAGAMEAAEAEKLLLHAGECEACARSLRLAIQAVGGNETPIVFAAPRRVGNWRLWAAAAAALVAGVLVWNGIGGSQPPLQELAIAYQKHRTVELRVAGAGYSKVSGMRGAAGEDPPELLASASQIERALSTRPRDPRWLQAAGRSALLQWKGEEAVRYLEAAAREGADSADFWVDAGTAYYERGVSTDDAAWYRKAIECLDKAATRNPAEASAFFNRGVVNALLRDTEGAIRDFEAARAIEPNTGWAREADERLRPLKQKSSAVTDSNAGQSLGDESRKE